MAKRFGRNQRRKMQEQIKITEAKARDAVNVAVFEKSVEISRLRQRLARSIEIDVDVLQEHARFAYEARVSAHMDARDGYYVAQLIDERQLAMQREGFIRHVSDMMAHKLARALGDAWGSGRNPFAGIGR